MVLILEGMILKSNSIGMPYEVKIDDSNLPFFFSLHLSKKKKNLEGRNSLACVDVGDDQMLYNAMMEIFKCNVSSTF
jgi:hypothetical protein